MIRSAKESYFSKHISNCNGDQNKLFNIVNSLLGINNQTVVQFFSPIMVLPYLLLSTYFY